MNRPAAAADVKFLVVAAENFWGSIAAQLAGDRAEVKSIVVDPSTDPHSYTATASDTEAVAQSQLAIVTGVGYDGWAGQALAADPSGSRVVLDVGRLLGLTSGGNPHQWYSPAGVSRVVGQIVADYQRLDPADAAYFDERRRTFETEGLAEYDRLREAIRSRYRGVPVGYSESIFEPLGRDLGLDLATPAGFAKAIAEGAEVTAEDKRAVDAQADTKQIKVWIFNSQNVTPDVQRVTAIARSRGIPIATVTETLSPASSSFQEWQVAQLRALAAALHEATGR
ncbi:MAG: metal ABC transporter solute-binding protein, Zn/Mn family [Solirubrobacteraceae bacterium]